MGLRIDLVDISHHQDGSLNFQKFKDSGGRGVYHKATEGVGFRDSRYSVRRVQVADVKGLRFGAYHFARPSGGIQDAQSEARFFLDVAKVRPGDMVPVLDIETNDAGLSKAALTDWIGAWCKVVETACGVKPVIYTPFDLENNFGCKLWVARYSNDNTPPRIPEPWSAYYMWQFSNGVFGDPKVAPGIGNVDLNVLGKEQSLAIVPEKAAPPVSQPPIVRTFVHASHNLLFSLPPEKWIEDLKQSTKAALVNIQEADGRKQRETLSAFCAKAGLSIFHPDSCGNPIVFNPDVFRPLQFRGVVDSHLGAQAMGIDVKFNPPRDFSYIGLKHIPTGQRILDINVHPLAEGTSKESAPSNTTPDKVHEWKDWGVGQYWLDVMAFTASQMSLQRGGTKSLESKWDAIILGGDFNAFMDNDRRWYYPGAMLPALYEADEKLGGLDHLIRTHGSDLVPGRRWSIDGNTDHRIHFQQYTLKEIVDFPRDI